MRPYFLTAITALLIHLVAIVVHGQDLFIFDRYEDSIREARAIERQASIRYSMARQEARNAPAPKWDTCSLSAADNRVLDSLDAKIFGYDCQWNNCKRLRGITSLHDRIDALNFYHKKGIMSKTEIEKFAGILRTRVLIELAGTQFVMDRQCGREKMKAVAHLKMIRTELSEIENYILALNNKPLSPEIKK